MGVSSFVERQQAAAMQHMREHSEEHNRVTELVLGSSAMRRGRRHITELVKLGDDYLVQVRGSLSDPDQTWWTFVVNGKASTAMNTSQENALLHLIATRHDPNPNTNHMWAAAAARVLGVSEPEGVTRP